VVIGANVRGGALDEAALAQLMRAAAGLDVTLHRAVDLCPDPVAAVRMAARLGIGRILSSGGAVRARDGVERLAQVAAAAGDQVSIMPGAGITPETVADIAAGLGISEIHASCGQDAPTDPAAQRLGFAAAHRRETSAETVAALRAALNRL